MISVIVPCLNEGATIKYVVEFAKSCSLVSEIIVVDDGSVDDTASIAEAAGAKVITASLLGKGAAMQDGLHVAKNEVIVYLDGDLSNLSKDLIEKIATPILQDQADFIKANFCRSAGRVTILTARPLLLIFFPEISHIVQPLGGIIAVKRSLLQKLHFESDYGVDICLLLDAAHIGARIQQVDIGYIEHNSHSLEILGDMARQVCHAILNRAARYNRLHLEQIHEVQEIERHAQSELEIMMKAFGEIEKLALFDMDGVILNGRFIQSLAERTHKTKELAHFLDNNSMSAEERSQQIAKIFTGVPRADFEQTARTVPLMPGAVDTIIGLRKKGYHVGIVTDSFKIASEIVRRRVFADFSVAHLMRFRNGVASGEISFSQAMQHSQGCTKHLNCKKNVMLHLCDRLNISVDQVVVIGDGLNDICLLESVGKSIAFCPKADAVKVAANHVVTVPNLLEVLKIAEQF